MQSAVMKAERVGVVRFSPAACAVKPQKSKRPTTSAPRTCSRRSCRQYSGSSVSRPHRKRRPLNTMGEERSKARLTTMKLPPQQTQTPASASSATRCLLIFGGAAAAPSPSGASGAMGWGAPRRWRSAQRGIYAEGDTRRGGAAAAGRISRGWTHGAGNVHACAGADGLWTAARACGTSTSTLAALVPLSTLSTAFSPDG